MTLREPSEQQPSEDRSKNTPEHISKQPSEWASIDSSGDTPERASKRTPEQAAIAYLRQPQAIRDRAQQLFSLCQTHQLEHFSCDLSKLNQVAAYVVETTQKFYPNFDVPFHSRWRHFDAGGIPRLARSAINSQVSQADSLALARSQIDLVIVSVLLDAGAGSQWHYQDVWTNLLQQPQQILVRSEGLAVASLRAFEQGLFSSDPALPYQVDAEALQHLTQAKLVKIFQVSADNPLVGLSGRLNLLQQLGKTLEAQPHRFGQASARPGNLLDYWREKYGTTLEAGTLLSEVLESFEKIWPGHITLAGTNLGDVWPHPSLSNTAPGNNLIPFHKLSQWLSYSLVEPLTAAGMTVTHLNQLTGLAEYRNGGLCVDFGLLQPKHPAVTNEPHFPSSPIVVEWRALTVVMLDLISNRVRHLLNKSSEDLPLIKVLEGGTWAAGRRIAQKLRPAGTPPIMIQSDGTVF